MANGDGDKPAMAAAFDPTVWMEAQRRNVEAFASAGRIVADGMRAVAERQAAMVQETMGELMGAAAGGQRRPQQPPGPQDAAERMRAAFERAASQVQEIGGLMLRAQAQAMEVLNACAAANMQDAGRMAPDLAAMQKAAAEAMQAATAQATAAVEEMRRRMGDLEGETRAAMAGAAAERPAEPPPQATKRAAGGAKPPR